MKIPIKNLFYILCYAWDVLENVGELEVGAEPFPDLENLMAHVLATAAQRLLRRGLEREYNERREDSKYIRGRIDLQETTKRMLSRRGEAHVISEELSPDTLANRILRATIGTLLGSYKLSNRNRENLAGLYHGLREISQTRISGAIFYRVRLHRNNQDYRLVLAICEMVHRYALPVEAGRGMRFLDFDRTRMMWKVFQSFVINFYRKHQTKYAVNADAFPWCVSAMPLSAGLSLPRLKTDIVLSSSSAQIVIDTKFFSKPFDNRFDKPTLWASHLNQIFAYMQNVTARDKQRRTVNGILMYGGVPDTLRHDWTLFGHTLRVTGVDLSKEWPDIESHLLSVIGSINE